MRRRVDVLLVCSSGGHLLQLASLRPAWEGYSSLWVTERASDSRSLLAGEEVVFAYGYGDRNIPGLIRNSVLALRLLASRRPRVVIGTGAAVEVPFAWLGRAFGARVVHVESVTRVERPSLSGRMIRPAAHRFYVQWPDLVGRVRGARFAGTIFPGR